MGSLLDLSGLICSFAGSGPLAPSTPLACAAPPSEILWQGLMFLKQLLLWQGVDSLQALHAEYDVDLDGSLAFSWKPLALGLPWWLLDSTCMHSETLMVVDNSCSGAALIAAGLHLVHALHSGNVMPVCILIVHSLTLGLLATCISYRSSV